MPSISSVLNIAKEALLTHQSSIAVAGHNVANVDTPGYSRQVLDLTTSQATPHRVGYFGGGVQSQTIDRQYDQYMVQRLMNQNSTIENLKALQQSMLVIETTFNEVPGLAINDLLSQYWESWQELSNNPEISASRQTVVQQADLLSSQLNTMSAEIIQSKYDIGVSLKSTITDINALTTQLADLNVKITSSETPLQEQNDMRDTRDLKLKDLSGLVDVTYFETGSGAYTILMSDGHTLVETNESWTLDWADDNLKWLSTNSLNVTTSITVGETVDLGGKVGGLVEMSSLLSEGNANNYLGRLDALANALIREVNQLHGQGTGLVSFSDKLTGVERANDAVLLHTSVDPLSGNDTVAAGTYEINGRSIGRIDGSITTNGLSMGKTFNAATAINTAEAGVEARMTTLVAGSAVTGLANAEAVTFTVNGITVTHTAAANETATETATNVVTAINTAIADYNNNVGLTPPQVNVPKMTLEAIVGNGLNGGATNAIVFRNTNQGDESRIIIADVALTAPETNLGLTDGTYVADVTHNTGELSLFSRESPITIDGGTDDTFLSHLGWAGVAKYSNNAVSNEVGDLASTNISFELNGIPVSVVIPDTTLAPAAAQLAVDAINLLSTKTGVTALVGDGTNGGILNSIVFTSETSNIKVQNYTLNAGTDILGFGDFTKIGVAPADQKSNDGQLSYTTSDNMAANSLLGLSYGDTVITDGASFDMWIYNSDGSLALAKPVSISLERAYNLQDVVTSINNSIINDINNPTIVNPWVTASIADNKLVLTPDSTHNFAFSGDTSNLLAATGLNSFFTGYDASSIKVNSIISNDLDKLAAGRINQFGEIFSGDNSNALLISNIQRDETITFTVGSTDTLDGFYNSLIAEIGIKGRSINTDLEYNELVNDQLTEIRDSTSGVSLDEEMANLIKYQHAYSAAAKMISISDELMQTLLNTI